MVGAEQSCEAAYSEKRQVRHRQGEHKPKDYHETEYVRSLTFYFLGPSIETFAPLGECKEGRAESCAEKITKGGTGGNTLGGWLHREAKERDMLTVQASKIARGIPHTAPARIDRYIEPGREKAWRLEGC